MSDSCNRGNDPGNTDKITAENTVVITTTLPHNPISANRRANMCNHFAKTGIPQWTQYGIGAQDAMPMIEKMFHIHKQRFETFLYRMTAEYGILCDDDFIPHPEFLEEVNATIALLPSDWRCLHLCPGYLWGRGIWRSGQRTDQPCGHLVPERDVNGLEYHESGRFYHHCGSGIWNGKHIWMGGPIAVLVRRTNGGAASLYEDYVRLYLRENNPNDVILTNILTHRDFICREPQLGWEDECGGTCFIYPPGV
jgi:hypothetical protein